MLRFFTSLFGCAHHRCTFPITNRKLARTAPESKPSARTYIVCLDCGKEFPYDWQKMKLATRTATTSVA